MDEFHFGKIYVNIKIIYVIRYFASGRSLWCVSNKLYSIIYRLNIPWVYKTLSHSVLIITIIIVSSVRKSQQLSHISWECYNKLLISVYFCYVMLFMHTSAGGHQIIKGRIFFLCIENHAVVSNYIEIW